MAPLEEIYLELQINYVSPSFSNLVLNLSEIHLYKAEHSIGNFESNVLASLDSVQQALGSESQHVFVSTSDSGIGSDTLLEHNIIPTADMGIVLETTTPIHKTILTQDGGRGKDRIIDPIVATVASTDLGETKEKQRAFFSSDHLGVVANIAELSQQGKPIDQEDRITSINLSKK